jgi:hypothetical protein
MIKQEILFIINKKWSVDDLWKSEYITPPPCPTIYHTCNIYGFFRYYDNAVNFMKECNEFGLIVSAFPVWGYNIGQRLDIKNAIPYMGTSLWGWIDEGGEERIFPYYPQISWQREDYIKDLSDLIID